VLGQPEHFAGIYADAFKDAVAVEEPVVVNTDLRVGLVVELAVDVDARGGHGLLR